MRVVIRFGSLATMRNKTMDNWKFAYCSDRRQIRDCPSLWIVVVFGLIDAAIVFTAIGWLEP